MGVIPDPQVDFSMGMNKMQDFKNGNRYPTLRDFPIMFFEPKYISRRQPVDIPREQACLPHILEVKQPGGKSFQSQAQPAVGWHTVTVHHQVALKIFRTHTPVLHFFKLHPIVMNTLTAGSNLKPRKIRSKLNVSSGFSGSSIT